MTNKVARRPAVVAASRAFLANIGLQAAPPASLIIGPVACLDLSPHRSARPDVPAPTN